MLHGENDPHPAHETHALLSQHIPEIRLIAYPHCGDEPWHERHAHAAFLADLKAWLTQHAA